MCMQPTMIDGRECWMIKEKNVHKMSIVKNENVEMDRWQDGTR